MGVFLVGLAIAGVGGLLALLGTLTTDTLVGAGAMIATLGAVTAAVGVVLLLISAGLAIAFQDDMAVKMRGTIVGTISAVLFLGDGLLGGNRLGKALTRYLPYNDVDPGRLALGMGVLGLVMAGLVTLLVAWTVRHVWLFYTTFVDFFLIMVLIFAVFAFARGKLFPPRGTGGA